MSGPRAAAPATAAVDVLLASDLLLIAESVAAALRSRGCRTTVLRWPGPAASLRQQIVAAPADVGVLLYDVDVSVRMASAVGLMRAWAGPWLVLTGAPPGPAWGGLVVGGAAAVRTRDLSLGGTESLVRALAAGQEVATPETAEHVRGWQRLQARHGELQHRLDTLGPRQLEVLTLLYQGIQVEGIARRLGLAESTVRSQVHSILRKLGVRSQLAAVARLHAIEQAAADDVQSTGDRQSTW